MVEILLINGGIINAHASKKGRNQRPKYRGNIFQIISTEIPASTSIKIKSYKKSPELGAEASFSLTIILSKSGQSIPIAESLHSKDRSEA